jgi:hypothetical protein
MMSVRRTLPRRVAMLRPTLTAAVGALAVLAAGCGGTRAPSVANLGATTSAISTAASAEGSTTAGKPSAAAFAACLGRHGFASSPGSAASARSNAVHLGGVTLNGNVDPTSPQFQAAMQACRTYLPGGGPPSLTPAQAAQWAKAMARFARCMRANGVPSFPDPSGDGRFPRGSLDGIDPASPLLQKAFKGCESLEPRIGPRIGF